MKILEYIIPITFLFSAISGFIGATDIAYFLLAVTVASLIGFLAFNAISTYILVCEPDSAECEYIDRQYQKAS